MLELRNTTAKRQSQDVLPYLPRFRHFFISISAERSEIELEAVNIPLNELECVTLTSVRVSVQSSLRACVEAELDRPTLLKS